MASYNAGAYGPNPNAGVNVNADHGWGGYQWPGGVPANLLGTATYQGVSVLVRKELCELYTLAFAIAKNVHGYTIYTRNPNGNGEDWGPWGTENRCIAGSNTASNHSKGKAMDWNAPYNGYASCFAKITSDFPPAMVAHLEQCGICWGGRYGDAMHWEYGYTPNDVAGDVLTAKNILGGSVAVIITPNQPPSPPVEEDDMAWTPEQLVQFASSGVERGMKAPLITGMDGKLYSVADYLADIDKRLIALETRIFNRTPGSQSITDEILYQTSTIIEPGLAGIAADTAESRIRLRGGDTGVGQKHEHYDMLQGIDTQTSSGQPGPVTVLPVVLSVPDTYTVLTGDTMSGIAKQFHTTVDILVALNHILNPDNIAPGDIFQLPKA